MKGLNHSQAIEVVPNGKGTKIINERQRQQRRRRRRRRRRRNRNSLERKQQYTKNCTEMNM